MGILGMKRIYEEATPEDGRRILVDRLWPRGMKKERAYLDEWAKTVAPSAALRKLYHGGEMGFYGFEAAYLDELEQSTEAANFKEALAGYLDEGNVTLLYANKNTEQNHVHVLMRWLRFKLEEG